MLNLNKITPPKNDDERLLHNLLSYLHHQLNNNKDICQIKFKFETTIDLPPTMAADTVRKS